MDQAGGENFAILHLVLLELSLDHSAASLIVGHQFNLMHNIQLFERQLGFHLLGKLEERPRGSDTLFVLSGIKSRVILAGCRSAIAAEVRRRELPPTREGREPGPRRSVSYPDRSYLLGCNGLHGPRKDPATSSFTTRC